MKSLMREKWETYCEISGHFRQLRGADARNWNHYLPSPLRAAGLGPAHDAATPWSGTTQHRRFDKSATQVPRQERCPPDEPCSSEHDRDADGLCPAPPLLQGVARGCRQPAPSRPALPPSGHETATHVVDGMMRRRRVTQTRTPLASCHHHGCPSADRWLHHSTSFR